MRNMNWIWSGSEYKMSKSQLDSLPSLDTKWVWTKPTKILDRLSLFPHTKKLRRELRRVPCSSNPIILTMMMTMVPFSSPPKRGTKRRKCHVRFPFLTPMIQDDCAARWPITTESAIHHFKSRRADAKWEKFVSPDGISPSSSSSSAASTRWSWSIVLIPGPWCH